MACYSGNSYVHVECGSFKDCLGLTNLFHTGMGTVVRAVWHAVPKHCVLIQGPLAESCSRLVSETDCALQGRRGLFF